jgi:hypothetical protein
LVLPPVNQTTDVMAGYSFYTTTTTPLSEHGFYVMPLGLVDRYMKENGMSMPDEMRQVPSEKLHEIFGADAVLYLTVTRYGSKYQVISTNTYVSANAELVDTRTGTVLWRHSINYVHGGQGGLLESLVEQVLNSLVDQAHNVCYPASEILLREPTRGLLIGPRHPDFGKEKK